MSSKHPSAGPSRSRPRGGTSSASKAQKATASSGSTNPFSDDDVPQRRGDTDIARGRGRDEEPEDEDDDLEEKKTIPPELLTRILHEFFEKSETRISKDANKAVAKYMDIFVREAIARTAVEKGVGFLEVDDLEKIAPQLLMDL
ncbi:CENP-S associating centromere protein X-domain-containing protein [Poronia punctata]|nr:CENP-S associating centromere protein X-domain-containing protein [Poronia punctata]